MSEQASAGAIKSGESYVEFFAVDGKLDKALTKIGNRLKAFGSFATKAGALLTAAGAGAATGVLALAQAAADAGSAVDDMSQRTGVAVKFISEMRYATQMSGTSIEAFEKAVNAMSKALYGADEESKTAVKTLSNLGLSITGLKGMKPEQAFLAISDALSKVEDPTRRSALAMKVFGKSGTELIPMLSGGKAGIEEMMKAAERLGYSLSDENAKAAAELGDQIDAVKMSFGGLTTQIGLAVAGPLTDWAVWTRDQIPAATKWIKEHQGAIVTVGKLAAGAAVAGSALTSFGIAATGVGLGLTQAVGAAGGLMKAVGGMSGALRAAGMMALAAVAYGIAAAIKHWAGNQEELNRQLAITNRLNTELEDAERKKTQGKLDETRKLGLGDRRKQLEDELGRQQKNLQASSNFATESRRQLSEASGFGNTVIDMTFGSGELDALRQDVKDADARTDSLRETIKTLEEELDKVKGEQAKFGREASTKKSSTAWAGRMGKKAFAGAQNWGQGVLTTGTGLFEAGKDLAKQVEERNTAWEQKLIDDAQQIKESNKTPEEKRKERLDRLDEMLKGGRLSEKDAALERAKIGLEAAQEKADKLDERVQKRESLNVGISDDQKNLLAAQAGRMNLEDETRKNTGKAAMTLDEVLAEQRRLNAWLTANGISLVEVEATA